MIATCIRLINVNSSRLILLLGIPLAASLAVSGCQGEPVDPLNSGIVTNEPLIDGSREANQSDLRPSSAEESAGGDSYSQTGSTPYPTPLSPEDLPDGVSPALAQDAQWYADQYGVSLEEAINRLMLQVEIGELGTELESKEADTLAGIWIQHEPDYRVVVAFTRDGEATISKYVQDGPLAEIIEVRTAQATLRDLQKAQKDAGKLVQGLGFNIASGIDIFENRVELYATDRAVLEEALREEGKTLPNHVVIIGP